MTRSSALFLLALALVANACSTAPTNPDASGSDSAQPQRDGQTSSNDAQQAVDTGEPSQDASPATDTAPTPTPDVTQPPGPDATADVQAPPPDVTTPPQDARPSLDVISVPDAARPDAQTPGPDATIDVQPPRPDATVDVQPPRPDAATDVQPPRPDATIDVVPGPDAAADAARDAATDVRPPTDAATGNAALEEEILRLVNETRARGATCGGTAYPPVAALTMNAQLRQAARLHSQDMADRNYFSHTGLDGSTPSVRAMRAGYTGGGVGENIAAGNATAAATMMQWMNSTGHCTNIMNGSYRVIGIGYGYNATSTYRHYWTQMFGR